MRRFREAVLVALAVAALPVAGVAATASSAATTTEPARTSTSLSATPNASKAGGYVTFKGETNYILNGRWADLPNSTVTILYLVRGTTTWHTFAQFKTNSTGNYSQRYRFNFKTAVHFHARVEPTASTTRSYSPLVDVVPLTVYANCTAMHTTYKHGVGRTGARDHVTSGTPVTTFFVSTALYDANTKLDRDKDGVACEAP
jgi:Excalibur calcium-binding domain